MLSNLLKDKNIDYTESHNIKEVIANGFMSAPVLKIDDKYMAMPDALRWVNEQ
jgi:glutaredoxin